MATAVREADLSGPLRDIEAPDSSRQCMVVLRWRRRVVGRLFMPVQHGRLSAHEIADAIKRTASSDPAILA